MTHIRVIKPLSDRCIRQNEKLMKTIGSAFRESTTFKLVFSSWLVVFAKFLGASMSTPWGSIPPMSVGEFSTAVAALLVVWVGREWRAAHYAE